MSAFTVDQVIRLARGIAGLRGARTSITVSYALTDRGKVLELLRPEMVVTGGQDLSTPVYAVLIEGSFPARPVAPEHSRFGEREVRAVSSILLLVEAATGHVVSSKATAAKDATPNLGLIDSTVTGRLDTMPFTDWTPADLRALQSPPGP